MGLQRRLRPANHLWVRFARSAQSSLGDTLMPWLVVGVVLLVALGAYFWWQRRKKQQHRLISIVAMTRTPTRFDPAVLARVAGRIWDADLGDGVSEGDDGFVV